MGHLGHPVNSNLEEAGLYETGVKNRIVKRYGGDIEPVLFRIRCITHLDTHISSFLFLLNIHEWFIELLQKSH